VGGLPPLEKDGAVQGVTRDAVAWGGCRPGPTPSAVQADAHQRGVVAVKAGGPGGEHCGGQLRIPAACLAQGLGRMSQKVTNLEKGRRLQPSVTAGGSSLPPLSLQENMRQQEQGSQGCPASDRFNQIYFSCTLLWVLQMTGVLH